MAELIRSNDVYIYTVEIVTIGIFDWSSSRDRCYGLRCQSPLSSKRSACIHSPLAVTLETFPIPLPPFPPLSHFIFPNITPWVIFDDMNLDQPDPCKISKRPGPAET